MEDSRFTEDYELERLNREVDSVRSGKKRTRNLDRLTNSRDLAHHFEVKQRK